ncbi:uncharacterized protein LOC131631842 [Vicia villosa]|uniref:uncharacterized protein LOC131631842 n=1 Tax=Vicia villosa TaxID=3911 RepID=UPI00273C4739|nr:uncharacterized protein LOC131631842 [Vicia villosa]XP_058758598.1 uncharacterized protein LOC131631842 [Vicia villosa]
MTMAPKESFKGYAQKWRNLAGRVQPPLSDRELVDMFMGTLTGPFYSHLLGSSSSGFTDLILTGERVESGIQSGKIQVGSSSGTTKRPISGRNEVNTVHSQKGRNKSDHHQSVGAVLISTSAPQQDQPPKYTRRSDAPRRNFTKINMPISQALQHLLKVNLITLRDPPKNVNTSSPSYRPDATCAYHSNSPGHDADHCWALKNKIQDMIDAGEIEFDPPEIPNVITAPMPKHDKAINVVDDASHVADVMNLTTSLLVIKAKLLQSSLFLGCNENCYHCASQSNGCAKLKEGIQRLMNNHAIMFERIPHVKNYCQDLSVISTTPVKIPANKPVKITAAPRVAYVIITNPAPFPYSSDKAVPWSYVMNVYVYGVKQDTSTDEAVNVTNPVVDNIVGTSKITRSGRVFSPDISPNVTTTPV